MITRLLKAAQLALFGDRKEVMAPGSRGGKYRVTPAGHIRYDDPPTGIHRPGTLDYSAVDSAVLAAKERVQGSDRPSSPPPTPAPPSGGGGGGSLPPPDDPPREFWIPDFALPKLQERIDKLNKRARRLKVPEMALRYVGEPETRRRVWSITVEPRGYEQVEIKRVRYLRPGEEPYGDEHLTPHVAAFHHIEIDGESPKLAGWQFIGVVEHADDDIGNIVKMSEQGMAVPEEAMHGAATCDHCKLDRKRNQTYLVKHDDGRVKRIGSDCMKDFLGHDSASQLMAMAEMRGDIYQMLTDLGGMDDGMWEREGGGRPDSFDLGMFLEYTAAVVRHEGGFLARGHPDVQALQRVSTADSVLGLMEALGSGKKLMTKPTDGDKSLARRALEWAEALYDDPAAKSSDYLWNLAVIAKRGVVSSKHVGYAASIISAFSRDADRKAEAETEIRDSNFVGETGKRQVFENVTVKKIIPIEGIYGQTLIHKLVDPAGNVMTWFASGQGLREGCRYNLKATVKKHDVFRDVKQTIVSRAVGEIIPEPEKVEYREERFDASGYEFGSAIDDAKYAAEEGKEPARKKALKRATELHAERTAIEHAELEAAKTRKHTVMNYGEDAEKWAKWAEYMSELRAKRIEALKEAGQSDKLIAKARRWFLLKAAQLGFGFAPQQEVMAPGSRGGRYRVTPKGKIRYDQPAIKLDRKPAPAMPLFSILARVPTTVPPDPKLATKFRQLADAMQVTINGQYHPGSANQNPTARRARIAAGMFQEGERLEGIQSILYGLADEAEQGKLPPSCAGIKNRTQVEHLIQKYGGADKMPELYLNRSNVRDVIGEADAYDVQAPGREEAAAVVARNIASGADDWKLEATQAEQDAIEGLARAVLKRRRDGGEVKNKHGWGVNVHDSQAVVEAFKEAARARSMGIATQEQWTEAREHLLGMRKVVTRIDKELRDLENSLIGTKIPGYFPTPKVTVEKLVEMADIEPGMTVLEPSAGKGNMCDVIRDKVPDVKLTCIEPVQTLRQILEYKGHELVGTDFMEWEGEAPDRICQNPPFENGQDVAHVRHAYAMLKPGGRLVSIMGEHSFFADDAVSRDFREWLVARDAEVEKLPAGSFKSSERPTGVNTRVIVVDKPPATPLDAAESYSEPTGHAPLHQPSARDLAREAAAKGFSYSYELPATDSQSVTVYRGLRGAAPAELRPGDWITLDQEIALRVAGGDRSRVLVANVSPDVVIAKNPIVNEWAYEPTRVEAYSEPAATAMPDDAMRELRKVAKDIEDAKAKLETLHYRAHSRAQATTREARSGQLASWRDKKEEFLSREVRAALRAGQAVPPDLIEAAGSNVDYNEAGNYDPIIAKAAVVEGADRARRQHLLRERERVNKELFYLLEEDLPAADDRLAPVLHRQKNQLEQRRAKLSGEIDQLDARRGAAA